MIPRFQITDLPKASVPTLVLHGARSLRTEFADAEFVAKHYGRAGTVRTFSRSSRMPFVEEPKKFLKVVRQFLKGR